MGTNGPVGQARTADNVCCAEELEASGGFTMDWLTTGVWIVFAVAMIAVVVAYIVNRSPKS